MGATSFLFGAGDIGGENAALLPKTLRFPAGATGGISFPLHGPSRFDCLLDDQFLCLGKVQPFAAGFHKVLVVCFIVAHGGAEVKKPLNGIPQVATGERHMAGAYFLT